MKRESKAERKFKLLSRLQAMGFSYEESQQLRRIETTLHRWAEAECNGEIQRDEKTGKPYAVRGITSPYSGKYTETRWQVADREAGALKRLKAILADKPELGAFRQGDPRGCQLYVFKRADFSEEELAAMDCHYSRGIAVCI